jgi:hypothetical protein
MKTTIADPGVKLILEHQLRKANVQFHDLQPLVDVDLQEHTFAVFTTMLCEPDRSVTMAYVVTVEGHSGYYNQDCYPNPSDAVAQHIGRLAADGKLQLVDIADVTVEDNEVCPDDGTI